MDLMKFMPAWNATLNGLSGVLIVIGFLLIRKKRVQAHKRAMLTACCVSILFLISCVTYHSLKDGVVTRFTGTGAVRMLYLTILTSHTMLAVTIVPLAIVTVIRGLKGRVEKHRRIARWLFPLWLYVSVTGVLVYFFLYQWYPSS
jgi:putative membrane protein